MDPTASFDDRSLLARSVHVAVLALFAGGVAVATDQPLLFPSLGPTAYVLATVRDGQRVTARRVVGGHAVGVVAGGVALAALHPGSTLTAPATPLVASATLALVLTTVGMLATRTVHPPACATTLIVSLGLLRTPASLAAVLVAVCLLYVGHRGLLAGLAVARPNLARN